jgi:hypothetical protein
MIRVYEPWDWILRLNYLSYGLILSKDVSESSTDAFVICFLFHARYSQFYRSNTTKANKGETTQEARGVCLTALEPQNSCLVVAVGLGHVSAGFLR